MSLQESAVSKCKKEEKSNSSTALKYAQIGGAAVVGGALIGLSGGVAVPAVIAVVGLVTTAIGVGGGIAAAMAG